MSEDPLQRRAALYRIGPSMATAGCLLGALLVLAPAASSQEGDAADGSEAPPERAADPADPPPAGSGPAEVAPDREREQRTIETLRLSVHERELVELDAGAVGFHGLYARRRAEAAEGALLLLHDQAGHADDARVIGPLRRALPDAGWSTLSLQLPLLPADESPASWHGLLAAAVERVRVGVAFLQARNEANIVVLGHGTGAILALLCGERIPGVAGVVVVSLPSGSLLRPPRELDADLESLTVPLLDVYAAHDTLDVRRGAARREPVLQGSPLAHRQIEIPAGTAGFHGSEALLISRVRGWLGAELAGRKLP